MTVFLRASLCALALVAAAAPLAAKAQSTDGFHAVQVIPAVVDTASFRSRLTFSNPSSSARTIQAYYIPAEGTSQAAELDCGTFTLLAGQSRTFESLREVCNALPGGSQFGTLHTMIASPVPASGLISYAAYARVENPQGIGFSVEAFPGHILTNAIAEVHGLRRLAATASSPAYQTNCFLGALHHELPNTVAQGTTVYYDLYDGTTNELLASQELEVPPGKLLRILDIFAHAGLPAGDYDNVTLNVARLGTGAFVAFCTVQDNTSFGADFRIAKQFYGFSPAQNMEGSPMAQDDHVMRRTATLKSILLTDGAGGSASQMFTIPANGSSNAHLIQFRNPDWASCEVVHPGNFMPLTTLEIRLLRGYGVVAGGNNVNSFGPVYLGDKHQVDSNSRYILEVEGTEPGSGVDTPYLLRCRSGSGHSQPDLVRSGGPNQF